MWKWLYPGMGVKRWLLLIVSGLLLIGLGLALLVNVEVLGTLERQLMDLVYAATGWFASSVPLLAGALVILAGVVLIGIGFRGTIRSLIGALVPEQVDNMAGIVYQRQHLKKGPRVVVLGGGTGLGTLLRGLKDYTSNITAIVAVSDDGGSSGRLRQELGMLPPGDVRNTLVALADTEPLMERLFQYRFPAGQGLEGHNFGNLFIATMTSLLGDFEQAIRESSRVLAIRGQVLPATLRQVTLKAVFVDGTEARGETAITAAGKRISRVYLEPADVRPVDDALAAIAEADAVVLGPGSLYTSVLPNLLVGGIARAIRDSQARKVYVCNVMTQPGETDGYGAADHVQALLDHVDPGLVEYCIVNSGVVPPALARKYRDQQAFPVTPDVEEIRRLGVTPIARPLISETNLVRHDAHRLAAAVMELIYEGRGGHAHMSGREPAERVFFGSG